MRANLIAAIERGETRFPGIVGYDKTALPQIENAIMSGHDFILLGLRGQAKTRILRALPAFSTNGSRRSTGASCRTTPSTRSARRASGAWPRSGGELPVRWIPREERYREKLATPDVTIADLIGDIDPIKAANKRLSYSDPEVMHYGIIPRTNRGIFAINELPDLQRASRSAS